jgi:hypothetical protein
LTVPNLMLSWQEAAAVAGALGVLSIAGSWASSRGARNRARAVVPFAWETGIILALYALWQVAGGLSLGHTAEAVHRGARLWHLERVWHLPSEAWVQNGILHHPLLVQICNIYYATMHFGVLIAMLVWLFVYHRDAYPRIRTTIVLTTTACLLVGLVPVAPPRLIHVGMVDTAQLYGQSVYAGAIGADQYSAMPSVHVAWAALVAVAVISVSRSRWRWLILLHTAATLYVVAATANHFWMDGVVAIALLGISLATQELWRRVAAERVRGLLPRQATAGGHLDEVAEDDDVTVG